MKKILISVAALFLILLVAIISIPFVVDVNDYKDQITTLAKEQTGVDIKIKGDINLVILPDVGLKIEKVSIPSSIEKNSNFLSLSSLVLKLKLIPLLNKKIEVESFKLISPVVNLHKDTKGNSNWNFISNIGSRAVNATDEPLENYYEEPSLEENVSNNNEDKGFVNNNDTDIDNTDDYHSSDASNTSIHEMLRLKNLEIIEGKLKFLNETTGQEIEISKINLKTSLESYMNNFDLSARLDIFKNKSKGNISLKGKYYLGDDQYGFEKVSILLDEISGQSHLEIDLSYDIPDLKLAFYFEPINLNNYELLDKTLGNKISQSNIKPKEEKSRLSDNVKWGEENIDFGLLSDINYHFNLKSKGITYNDLELGETYLSSYLKNRQVTLDLKKLEIYDGTLSGKAVIDGSTKKPLFENKLNFKNIDLSEIPSRFNNIDKIDGVINGSVDLKSSGNSELEIVKNLNGKSNFIVSEGAIEGVNLFAILNNVKSLKILQRNSSSTKTRFEEVSANLKINNGIILNDDLVLKSDILNFAGEGNIDLPNLLLEYRLTPKFSQDFEDEKASPNLPIAVRGSIFDPSFRVEVKDIVQDLIKNPDNAKNIVDRFEQDFKSIKKSFEKDLDNNVINEIKNLKDLFR